MRINIWKLVGIIDILRLGKSINIYKFCYLGVGWCLVFFSFSVVC